MAASSLSLTCWLAAITTLVLYANRIGLRSTTGFMLTDSWLIGAGSIGVPVLMLGFLGRRLTPRTLELIAAMCITAAIAVTVFVGTGQAHLGGWTACFLLILTLAPGVQAINGAYGLHRRQQIAEQVRAEEGASRERDVREAFLAGILAAKQAQDKRAEELEANLDLPTGELEVMSDAYIRELEQRRARHTGRGRKANIHLIHSRSLPPTGSEHE